MSDDLFAMTDHACRICAGRVLRLEGVLIGGKPIFRCSVCSVQGLAAESSICACGLKPAELASGRPTGFKCVANPNKSAAAPADIVIAFASEDA